MATKKTASKTTAPEKAAPLKKNVAAKIKAAPAVEKKSDLQQQLETLHAQMQALNQEAVGELKAKISDTKKVLRGYELQLETLTGKVAGTPKIRRERRPSISDDDLKGQMLKMIASAGKDGMNAKQLGENLNQDALRIRKFIKDNPKVLKRVGNGPGTKFHLA